MIIKRIKLVLAFVVFFLAAKAQDSTIVQWRYSVAKLNDSTVDINFVGKIKSGWHVYTAANAQTEISGITSTVDEKGLAVKPLQIVTKGAEAVDAVWQQKLRFVSDSVLVTQSIISKNLPNVFEIKLHYEVANTESFYPESITIDDITLKAQPIQSTTARLLIPTIQINKPLSNCKTASSLQPKKSKGLGLLSLFIVGFLGGLVALFTPCVFPMIPLTVSFFTKKAITKKAGIANAFLYGFFIFFIYILLSAPFHFLDSLRPDILNNISTNVYLNVIFFIVFVLFALSFFGLYEITLPSAFTNKTDSKSSGNNVVGIFFMALTLALVSFSCTGPILGSLLAGSLTTDGGAIQLTAGMGGFGLALALPFGIFALFPGLLSSLPKSGSWLTTVKVVLGFLELGLAFKFLSNADLVTHWGILKREIFIGIWIIIGVLLSLYLWAIYPFNKQQNISLARKCIALMATVFTLYLLPGVTNTSYANLKLISGFPPPLWYSIYATKSNCVLNLNCTKDYETGLQMAKEQNKLILLDFTGYACVNCRRMEEKVWSKPKEYALLKENFIIISLYVDDKMKLPQSFKYTTKSGDVRLIKTVGDKWSVFETENFNEISQPLYAMLNTKEELLAYPSGYAEADGDFLQWLQCGIQTATVDSVLKK